MIYDKLILADEHYFSNHGTCQYHLHHARRMLRPWLDARGYWAPGRGAPHSHYFHEKGGGKFWIPAHAAEEFHSVLAADLSAGVRHSISEVHTAPAFRLALDLDCKTLSPLPLGELLQLCAAVHLAVRAFYFERCSDSGYSCSRLSSGSISGSSASSSGSSMSGSGSGSSMSGLSSPQEPTVLALNTAGTRAQKDGSLLTGAHLIFPGILTDSAAALACRTAVLSALRTLPAARHLCNGLEAALDASVLRERAGLRMVGTYKQPSDEGVYLPTHLLHPASGGASSAHDLHNAAAAVAEAAQEVRVAGDDAQALAVWMQRASLRVHGEGGEMARPASSGLLQAD